VILYEDESDFGLYSGTQDDWSPVAEQEKVGTRGKNRKRYVFGAQDAFTGASYMRWAGRKNGDNFVRFLESLVKHLPGKRLVLILDNFGVHKCRRVRQWLEETGAPVELVFLPTYSPWLNRIENTWRVVKRRAYHNTWHDTTGQLVRDVSLAMVQLGATILCPSFGQGST